MGEEIRPLKLAISTQKVAPQTPDMNSFSLNITLHRALVANSKSSVGNEIDFFLLLDVIYALFTLKIIIDNFTGPKRCLHDNG